MSRMLTYLGLLTLVVLASDLSRQYPPGQEPAKGNQNLDVVYPNGQELADNSNCNLAGSWNASLDH